MIKYTHKYKNNILLYNTNFKIGFYPDIYLGYKKIISILSIYFYDFSLLNDTFGMIFSEKPNCFQY